MGAISGNGDPPRASLGGETGGWIGLAILPPQTGEPDAADAAAGSAVALARRIGDRFQEAEARHGDAALRMVISLRRAIDTEALAVFDAIGAAPLGMRRLHASLACAARAASDPDGGRAR